LLIQDPDHPRAKRPSKKSKEESETKPNISGAAEGEAMQKGEEGCACAKLIQVK